MALKFDPNYKIIDQSSSFSEDFMNPIFQDIDLRLDVVEKTKFQTFQMQVGTLTVGTKARIILPYGLLNFFCGLAVSGGPAGGPIIVDISIDDGGVFKSLYTADGVRPQIADGAKQGTFAKADQNINLVLKEKIFDLTIKSLPATEGSTLHATFGGEIDPSSVSI